MSETDDDSLIVSLSNTASGAPALPHKLAYTGGAAGTPSTSTRSVFPRKSSTGVDPENDYSTLQRADAL
jgi:hypothetical protein